MESNGSITDSGLTWNEVARLFICKHIDAYSIDRQYTIFFLQKIVCATQSSHHSGGKNI